MYTKPLVVQGDNKNKSSDNTNNQQLNRDPNLGNIMIQPEDHFTREQDSESKKLDKTRDMKQSSIDYTEAFDHGYKPMNRVKTNDEVYPVKAYSIYDANEQHFPTIDGTLYEPPSDLTNNGIDYTNDPRFAKPDDPKNHPGYIKYTDGHAERVFSGSATVVNPTLDFTDKDYIEKNRIMKLGLGEVENEKAIKENTNIGNKYEKYVKAPTTPLHPFFRMDPLLARKTNLVSYNRSHTPISDIEFRKCFRHILITRPECYIMSNDGRLSQQAASDEDFASLYGRMPYICQLLSPRYLSGQTELISDGLNSNWNYLLSNRVMGLSYESIENSITEGIAKTTHNFTVSVANAQASGKEGALQLAFRDTRYFEIFELIRMWMLYMHKRHIGTFAPPFNGYEYENGFMNNASASENGHIAVNGRINLHPYDRALEYPCTIFDIITDETDSRIIHYSEYIGAYPYQMSAPLNNDSSGPITGDMKVTVGFRYSAKIINNNRVLTHFNYNAGITDNIGQPTKKFQSEVVPFLLQHGDNQIAENQILMDYSGQASMFTGTPYIVLKYSGLNPLKPGAEPLYSPYLKFAPVTKVDINMGANMGITHEINHTSNTTTKSGASTTNENTYGKIAGIESLQQQVSNTFTGINSETLQQQLEEAEKRSQEAEAKYLNVGAKNKVATSNASQDLSSIMSQTLNPDWSSYVNTVASKIMPGISEVSGAPASEYLTSQIKHEVGVGWYIDGVLVANKSYSLDKNYVPNLNSAGTMTNNTEEAFNAMAAAAAKEGLTLTVKSGYRSYSTQQSLYDNYVARDGKVAADTYSARPGHSEHQTGLAIDINKASDEFTNTPEAKWLAEHCWEYGFILRYPEGKESITGYKYESWHFRYVGTPQLAMKIKAAGSLEEYLGIDSKYKT